MGSTAPTLQLSAIEGEFVIAKLAPSAPVPFELFADDSSIVSVTRTSSELSIVCPVSLAPTGAEVDGPWAAWYIAGPIPFGLTGVVQAVVSPLSTIGIPVFVVSTFDSDIILTPTDRAREAESALRGAGHEVSKASGQ